MDEPQIDANTQAAPVPQPSQRTIAKNKRTSFFKKVMSVAILIFMVGWVFVFALPNSDNSNTTDSNKITVGGYDFYAFPDGSFGTTWTNPGGAKVPIYFRLDPRNASSVSIDTTVVQQVLSAKKIYLAFDPTTITDNGRVAVASYEISRITSLYGIETVGAYTKDSNPPNPSIPLRTCDDVSSTTTVIELGVSNATTATSIVNNKGCIKIFAKDASALIDAADKLGMNLAGLKL